ALAAPTPDTLRRDAEEPGRLGHVQVAAEVGGQVVEIESRHSSVLQYRAGERPEMPCPELRAVLWVRRFRAEQNRRWSQKGRVVPAARSFTFPAVLLFSYAGLRIAPIAVLSTYPMSLRFKQALSHVSRFSTARGGSGILLLLLS